MRYLKLFDVFESKSEHTNKELTKLIDWAIKFADCTTKKTKNGIILFPPKSFSKDLKPRTIHFAERAIFDVMRSLASWYGVRKKDIEEYFKNKEKPIKNEISKII